MFICNVHIYIYIYICLYIIYFKNAGMAQIHMCHQQSMHALHKGVMIRHSIHQLLTHSRPLSDTEDTSAVKVQVQGLYRATLY